MLAARPFLYELPLEASSSCAASDTGAGASMKIIELAALRLAS
jgi:hypothetical protein